VNAPAPEVTVVIPTHNRSRLLSDALRSALGQENVAVEVIVVDDASSDGTPSLLAALDDPRASGIRFAEHRGLSAARNAGIAAARGRWVAFLDDDDLWAPHKLRRQLDAAGATGATWVYCGVLLVSPNGDVRRMWGPPEPEGLVPQLLQSNVVQAGASTVVADRARLTAVGAFDETLGAMADRDLWIRLALDGPAAAVEEPLAAYRRHGSTMIGRRNRQTLEEADRVAERYADSAAEHGVAFDREHLERWLTSERIRSLRYAATAAQRDGQTLRAIRLQAMAFASSRALRDLRRLLPIVFGERARKAFRQHAPAEGGQGPRVSPDPG